MKFTIKSRFCISDGMKSLVLTCAQQYTSLVKVLELLQIIIGDNKGQLH